MMPVKTARDNQKTMHRRFSYLKLSLLLILVFNFEFKNQTQIPKQTFERDLQLCKQCFEQQKLKCTKFLENLIEDRSTLSPFESLLNSLPLIATKRQMLFWKLKTDSKSEIKKIIISKSITAQELQITFENLNKQNLYDLQIAFIESENLEGLQLCPHRNSTRLVQYIEQETQHSQLSIWLQFILDVEPLLMPLLDSHGFPVPKTFATCGLTLFQAFAGKSLSQYYTLQNFKVKLKMAQQLLEAVLKFSTGFEGFRIYITDLSADNLIWNEENEKLYFVDLDTIIIVDSKAKELLRETHKHIYIECENCFAYSQQEICAHRMSDINIFAACQMLREGLSRKIEAGFLYPIPAEISEKYPKFEQLLDECVDCTSLRCLNRFAVAEELLELFGIILEK